MLGGAKHQRVDAAVRPVDELVQAGDNGIDQRRRLVGALCLDAVNVGRAGIVWCARDCLLVGAQAIAENVSITPCLMPIHVP